MPKLTTIRDAALTIAAVSITGVAALARRSEKQDRRWQAEHKARDAKWDTQRDELHAAQMASYALQDKHGQEQHEATMARITNPDASSYR